MIKQSPVIRLLEIVYASSGGDGFRRLNHAMHTSLCMMIATGFEFQPGDFVEIDNRFKPSYWMGDGEGMYALACEGTGNIATGIPNRSAAIAFEAARKRKPFIVEGRRLGIRSEFRHPTEGMRLWVTSISAEEIGACWYDNPGNHQKGKPAKRFTFDHKSVKPPKPAEIAAG